MAKSGGECGRGGLERMLAAKDVPERLRLPEPALLIVDMQNDFVLPGAPLEVPDARATIPVIAGLADLFRERGRPVVYTRFLASRTPDLLWHWSPQCWPDTRCCWAGHRRRYDHDGVERDCAAVVDDLAPAAGDLVVDKAGYGAFHGTGLDRRLRDLGVQSLLVTGTVTQVCVEETAREAFHHGYRTTVVSDGVSSFAPDLHAATLKNFAMKFGWVADSGTVASWL